MSLAGFLDSDKMYKKPFQRRNDSDEIDVFEAARYFSGYNEAVGYPGASLTHKLSREERHGYRGRISLDVPIRNLLPEHHLVEKPIKEKKYKPSSPGGRLASFLNSLFSQSASKKKKSKSSSQSMKDEDESPGGRRRRRSSISHYRSSNYTDTRSIYSTSNSGFRTPPPYAHTPTKSYKEFRTFSDHKTTEPSFPKYSNNGHIKYTGSSENELCGDKKQKDPTSTVFDEKQKIGNCLSDKLYTTVAGTRTSDKDRVLKDKYSSAEKEFRQFDKVDEGAESDSSSDLFELQIYDLGYYPSGLPVYETTNIDNIKR